MTIYSETKKELRDIIKELEYKNLIRLLSCAKGLLKGQQVEGPAGGRKETQ